jgi:SMODS-associated and fused to various effectors sensor domain
MPPWLTSPESRLWLWIGRGSAIISYLAVLTVIGFLYNLLRHRRKRTELASIIGKTSNPHALALSFGGGSIKSAVEAYLTTVYPDVRMPVEDYEKGEVTPENIHRVEEEIRSLKEKYQTANVTELHLFMKGPVALALAVGAIFDNWVSVKIYHNDRGGIYEPWTTLHQAKAVPITEELSERVAQALDPHPE